MDARMAKEVIRIIRTERNERLERVNTKDDDYYYQIMEEPFINDLCLMLLVAIRHEIERKLTIFIAKKTSERKGHGHSRYEFGKWVEKERKRVIKNNWHSFHAELKLETGTIKWLEILRELSNSYKHDVWSCSEKFLGKLDTELKELTSELEKLYPGKKTLDLPKKQLYMAPPESPFIRAALAMSVGLASDADYPTIAETFVNLASDLLSNFEVSLFQLIVPINPAQLPR
jgi:hypothetical protein